MSLAKNIGPLLHILRSLKGPNSLRKELEAAQAAGDFEKEEACLLAIEKPWGKKLMDDFGVDLVVRGKEHIPEKGPVVLVCNHQSFVDIPVLITAVDTIPFGFVARDNLRKIPFIGPWMERIHCVLMQREDPRAALNSIKEGASLIEKGYSLLIFPEGTRAKDGPMGDFKHGALKLATKPKATILPISLNGTFDMYEKDGYFHASSAIVQIHPMVETSNLSREELKLLPDKLHDIINDGLTKLKEEMSAN